MRINKKEKYYDRQTDYSKTINNTGPKYNQNPDSTQADGIGALMTEASASLEKEILTGLAVEKSATNEQTVNAAAEPESQINNTKIEKLNKELDMEREKLQMLKSELENFSITNVKDSETFQKAGPIAGFIGALAGMIGGVGTSLEIFGILPGCFVGVLTGIGIAGLIGLVDRSISRSSLSKEVATCEQRIIQLEQQIISMQ